MRAEDLRIEELLEMDERGGVRFAGERAPILDAVALGLLRKQLVETLGMAGARAVLTRWKSEDEWRTAGARIHGLQVRLPRLIHTAGPARPCRTGGPAGPAPG
jgi:hypothetical protein